MYKTFQRDIKSIYDKLDDDLSKEIFTNRLLYSLTGDYSFINCIVSHNILNSLSLQEIKNKLNSYYSNLFDNVIVYGAGHWGNIFCTLCDKIDIVAYCDSNRVKQASTYKGYSVLSPEELASNYSNNCVVISTEQEEHIKEIENSLGALGVQRSKTHYFNFKAIKEIIPDIPDFSKAHKSQYFDSIAITPRLQKDEVFIDAGCGDFSTSKQFAEYTNNKYEKIIAFEPNPKQFPACLEASKTDKNVKVYPYGLWNENAKLSFYNSGDAGGARIINESSENTQVVNVVSLDNILDGERASFIKMDVEGAELNALIGAKETIQKYHPKLAICLYHKPEDIWEILSYILSLNDEYKLYIRHYSLYDTETVLYAV